MPKTNLNNIAAMSDRLLRKRVEQLGDVGVPFTQLGKRCLIHAGRPSPAVIKKRTTEFTITTFVMCSCPACQPFIKEGAFVFYAATGRATVQRCQSLSPLCIEVVITEDVPLAKPAEG